MTGSSIDKPTRLDLARRYAHGEFTIHELRDAGHTSMFELLADLADLGLRLPLADMVGPNVETRRAGIARLDKILGPRPV